MTAMELNASILKELSVIISNEEMAREALDCLRRLRRKHTKAKKQVAEAAICKEDILAGIDAGLKEVKLSKDGKLKLKTARELLDEL